MKAIDVDLSFDTSYVHFQKVGIQETVVKAIDNSLASRICIEESNSAGEDFSFKNIFYERIKSHCNLFSCFVFVKTNIFVSHGHFLSLFDVLKQ